MFVIAALLQTVWGLVPSASKVVIDEIPVELYIALRWSISSVLILALLWFRFGWLPPLKRETFFVGLLGIGAYALGSVGTLYGLKIGGVANFALTASLSSVITSATAVTLLRERPSRLFYFALPICVGGLALLVLGKHALSSWHVALGAAGFIIAADVLEAVIFCYSKRLKEKFTPLQFMAISQAAAALFMWVLQLAWYGQAASLGHLSLRGWEAAVYVSVVACFLCYAVLYWLLRHLDGHRLALFDGLHTLSATAFGVLFFAERLNGAMLVGGALLLAGLVLGNLPEASATA
jgi:drug/metabolite transporter (DMT)-like permease